MMSPWAMFALDVLAVVGALGFMEIVLRWAEHSGGPKDHEDHDDHDMGDHV